MKVSVLICAYNQQRYVEQAVRSALMQQTTFAYELVIGEDCSTDDTPTILRRLQAEFPDRIRLFCHEKNLGMHHNYRQTLLKCAGEYVALLEGDDYWTSPHKLQKQADFLDAHPECVLCFHDVLVFDQTAGTEHPYCRPGIPEITGFEDLLQDMYFNTASVMMKNLASFPIWGTDLAIGDWPYFLWMAEHGKFGFINEILSAYRKHGEGLWTKATVQHQVESVRKMYAYVNDHYGRKYDAIIRVLANRWAAYLELDYERRQWKAKAAEAEARIEELTRARRALKSKVDELTRELEAHAATEGGGGGGAGRST
jgi:glycosyltransferase involved in cell wall biosynthesis